MYFLLFFDLNSSECVADMLLNDIGGQSWILGYGN